MIRVKLKNIRLFLFIVVLAIIGIFPINAAFKVLVAMLQCIIIIAKSKISFFSIFTFLINFCSLQQYIAYIGGKVYGLLEMSSVPIYFNELCICTYCFNLIISVFILFSRIIDNEKKLYSVETNFTEFVSVIMLVSAVILTLLIFPSLPSLANFASGSSRFRQGIIPFSGWSIIPYFFLAVAAKNRKIRKYTIACVVFIVFWYAFHGERVEAIGFMVFMAIDYYHKNKNRKLAIIRIGIVGVLFIILFIIIGMFRSGTTEFSVYKVVNSIIVQPTACDVTYVFNCAVDAWYKGNAFSGITYLSYLVNCIPFANDPYSFANKIQDYYYTVGGGMFFAEPFANLGLFFTAFITFLFLYFIYLILKRPTQYGYLLYSTLCVSVFRIAWYGLNYPIITMLYFAPFVLLLNNGLKRNK